MPKNERPNYDSNACKLAWKLYYESFDESGPMHTVGEVAVKATVPRGHMLIYRLDHSLMIPSDAEEAKEALSVLEGIEA